MMSDAAVVTILDILKRVQTPYMVVGSLSCNVYTFPRSTHDADFVIQLDSASTPILMRALREAFQIEPQMSFESITGTSRYKLESKETGFKIELFLLSDDAHDRERFARRKRLVVEGHEACVASAEDVVITKLRWSRQGQRSKDIDDARNVIASQRKNLDWTYVEAWCDRHGTRSILNDIVQKLPATK